MDWARPRLTVDSGPSSLHGPYAKPPTLIATNGAECNLPGVFLAWVCADSNNDFSLNLQKLRDHSTRRLFLRRTSVARAKQAISDYKKAVGDPAGLAELMVFYCERAAGFCSDIASDDEGFSNALVRMFERRLEAHQVAIMLRHGGSKIVVPEFVSHTAHRREGMDMAAHKRLEALAVSELDIDYKSATLSLKASGLREEEIHIIPNSVMTCDQRGRQAQPSAETRNADSRPDPPKPPSLPDEKWELCN
jgi:hypothetical protein